LQKNSKENAVMREMREPETKLCSIYYIPSLLSFIFITKMEDLTNQKII